MVRNRLIAMYMIGGEKMAEKYIRFTKGRQDVLQAILEDVLAKCRDHRDHIKEQQVISIEDWVKKW